MQYSTAVSINFKQKDPFTTWTVTKNIGHGKEPITITYHLDPNTDIIRYDRVHEICDQIKEKFTNII